MTRKDYQRAAEIVRRVAHADINAEVPHYPAVEDAFIEFFRGDNPVFDEDKFCEACKPKG